MNLQIVRDEAAGALAANTRQILSDTMNLADQCIHEIRTFSYLLHPPVLDDLGLAPALNWYVGGFARRSGVHVDLLLPPDLERMPRPVETAIFRVVQESLINIHRQSGSKVARIRLTRRSQEVLLEVEDDGCGPRAGANKKTGVRLRLGLGIAGAEERLRELGGRLEFDQNRSRGLTVRAIVPVPPAESIS